MKMNCPNCQEQLETDSKFCTSCGEKVNQTNTDNSIRNEPVQTVETEQKNDLTNDYLQQGKEISKQYWNFIPSALAHPFATSKKVEDGDKINGIITLILFSLFIPLYTYTTLNSLGSGLFAPSFIATVIKPFLIFLIFFALLIAVKFGVTKLMKADVSYTTIMTRFGVMMVLPTIISLVAIIFALLNIYDFSTVLLSFSISFAFIASLATIFSIKDKAPNTGGLDVYYAIALTYAAMAIIVAITGDSIADYLFYSVFR